MAERYTDFKKGDIVRIRSWEDMENEFGVEDYGAIMCKFHFIPQMRKYCGTNGMRMIIPHFMRAK